MPTLQRRIVLYSPLMFITPKMPLETPNLELGELLDCLASSGQHTQNVEADLQTKRLVLVVSVVQGELIGKNVQSC